MHGGLECSVVQDTSMMSSSLGCVVVLDAPWFKMCSGFRDA